MSYRHELDDLDRAILRVLPDEGAKLGLYLHDAPNAPEIRKRLNDPTVGANLVGARLGLLRADGLTVSKRGKHGTHGWQRTKLGKTEAADAAEGGSTA